jgi:hypothetical protein
MVELDGEGAWRSGGDVEELGRVEERRRLASERENTGQQRQELGGGERSPGEKKGLGLLHPAVWTSKRRQVLARAPVSTRAACPGKRPGSRRDYTLPKGTCVVMLAEDLGGRRMAERTRLTLNGFNDS